MRSSGKKLDGTGKDLKWDSYAIMDVNEIREASETEKGKEVRIGLTHFINGIK